MKPWGVQEIVGVIGVFVLATVVITVTIWQLAVTWRAKAALAREHSYRTLAEQTANRQESIERQLTNINDRLTELHQRVDSVEQILKQIE